MLKFQFKYSDNQCFLIEPNNYGGYKETLIPDSQFFLTNWGGSGWQLDPNNSAHWITFTVFAKQISAFYKQPTSTEQQFIYYKKTFPKAEIITVEFTLADEVIKDEKGHWVFKNK